MSVRCVGRWQLVATCRIELSDKTESAIPPRAKRWGRRRWKKIETTEMG